jgi:hypothetical protein
MRKTAGLIVASLSIVWLIYVLQLYVRNGTDLLFFVGWVLIYLILWIYSILLRQREDPESQNRGRVIGLIIFIPVVAYLVQGFFGQQNKIIEMAAAISVFGLFISWGSRLYRAQAGTPPAP